MQNNASKFMIAGLLILLVWFATAIVRLENYHYAVQVGLCGDVKPLEKDECLNETETRTSPILHLFYGLGF